MISVIFITIALILNVIHGAVVLYETRKNKQELQITPWTASWSWAIYIGLILSLVLNLMYALKLA